jgi:hypothetical protein
MTRKSEAYLLEAIEQGQLNRMICLIKQEHNIYIKNIFRQKSLDSSKYFYHIETRFNKAKSLNDWKTVAALRAFKRNLNEKLSNRLCEYRNQLFFS